MAGLIWLWNQGSGAAPAPEPPAQTGLTGTAGATVLKKREPRKRFDPFSFNWEKFEELMAELEAKDAALAAKAARIRDQKRKAKVTKRVERIIASAIGATVNATPAVNPELERLVNTVTMANQAKTINAMLGRLDAVNKATAALEAAIEDEEEVEMLLLSI